MVGALPLGLRYTLDAILSSLAKVSEGGKRNKQAHIPREVGLEHGGPVMVTVVEGEIRMVVTRQVLAELHDKAGEVFAGSGENVDRLLRERQDEMRREDDQSA